MLTMNTDLEGALKEYLILMDSAEYFEAHEVLEEAWHPLRLKDHPLKNMVKGLINAAVAFEHLKRNKRDADRKALRVMESYERYKGVSTEQTVLVSLFKQAYEKIERLKLAHPEVFLKKIN